MTGNITGEGDWFRSSEPGKSATNESWTFTGDNSGFYGNWITTADVNYINKDKSYDYLPLVFGNGGKFDWYGTDENAFYKIAGHGAIIGGIGQTSRMGMGLGLNYNSDVILFNDVRGNIKLKHLTSSVLELRGTNTHVYGTYAEYGGTIRFSEAKNLGTLEDFNYLADGTTLVETGATLVLNNNSTLSFSGAGTESIKSALFNSAGKWNVNIEQASGLLKWDLSKRGIYDRMNTSEKSAVTVRTGAFTKKGAGTLDITAGSLLTSANSIFVEQGTLTFSGTGNWGKANKIVLGNQTTLRSDRLMTITSGMTLTTDKGSLVATSSTVDGNLTLNGGGIAEFVMVGSSDMESKNPLFNIFNVTGNFNISANQSNKAIFQFSFLNGQYVTNQSFYLLMTANNDLRTLDLTNIKLQGLVETNSRQKYQLYASGTSNWVDPLGNIHSEAYGNANGKELYLFATPDVATLTWDKATGGDWILVGDDSHRASWRGHDVDSRFYNNDEVIFGNNAGDTLGARKEINLLSNVSPSHVTVTGENHYVFTSANGSGIEGAGQLLKTGTGTLDIHTSNSYTGGTRLVNGTVNANAAQSFGTGTITVEQATLNVNATDGLGSSKLNILGGLVNIYSTNSSARTTNLSGGASLYAYGANSLGNGTLNVTNGTVYTRTENALSGTINLQGNNTNFYADADSGLTNANITISNGATFHTANSALANGCMGTGSSITLSDGGIVILNDSSVFANLGHIKFDGGEIRVIDKVIDIQGFKGTAELSNAKRIIFNIIGENARLTPNLGMANNPNASALKKGTGELYTELLGDYKSKMEIEDGTFHLRQGFVAGSTTTYTQHAFIGGLTGVGTMKFSGGSMKVTSDMSQFSGTIYVDLDNKDQFLTLQDDHVTGNRKLADVILNNGSIAITDTSGENALFWGNLSSGTHAQTDLTTIGFGKNELSETFRNHAKINITQTRDDEYKGRFINGADNGSVTTSLIKHGAAKLTLSNDSTSLGTLDIKEGVIKIGKGGTTGHWAGNIVNNSLLQMDYGNTEKIYSKEISGTGNMEISTGSTGNVVFSAKNTYTGDTFIKSGHVELREAGNLGSGEVIFSGKSSLNVTNATGVENSILRISRDSTATVKNAVLSSEGRLTTAAKGENKAAIELRGGTLGQVILDTTNNKATVSGVVTGTLIHLSAVNSAAQSPVLKNITLGRGSSAQAENGISFVNSNLVLAYGEENLSGGAGNKEIVQAKLALSTGGSYDLSQMTRLDLKATENMMVALQEEEKLVIHVFGKGADMEQVIAGDTTGNLRNIVLDEYFKNENWSVSKDSLSGNTAWWNNGEIVLIKNQVIPESSTATLFITGAVLFSLRRRRKDA